MNDLPNGFTGFAGGSSNFESAADAIRKSRNQAAAQAQANASSAARPQSTPSAQRYAGGVPASRNNQPEVPFNLEQLDRLAARERRWAWTEIDLSAIRHNVADVRRALGPRTRLMAVVKADAYGHGAVEASKAMLGSGADRLGVSSVDEALELRKAGIRAPILVLAQPPASAIPLLLGYNITPAVYSPEFAIAYAEMADLHGMVAPYHLAVNTGMNRIGIRYDEVVEFLYQVSFHRALVMEGVFTHYATADEPETLEFEIQTKRFVEALQGMHDAGFDLGIIHAANSAATYRYPDVQFDMVRCGLALYGFHPCPETRDYADLRPAMSVHARIIDTRFVPMSEGVSYGLHYRSPGSVKICTLPIGYADGLHRGLSGNTDFIMGGRYYRQVGNICMDQCMFEVDMRSYASRERVDPQVGDEVIIVGNQGIAQVTIDEIAEKLDTIPYEIAIGFSHRLDRIYV